jgi:hypothetical protein
VVAVNANRPVPPPPPSTDKDGDYDGDSGDNVRPPSNPPASPSPPPVVQGYYSCSALEALWESAGGSYGTAFIAAEIAMAESGGNPNAISPTNDYGLWQINGSHGAQATLDPLGNARAAVAISSDGTDWSPWTTFTSGAYIGQC